MKPERYLCGFDTEDDQRGTPTLFTFVHERGNYYCRDRHSALEFLLHLSEHTGRRQLEVWAVNLEYDAVNLWGEERIGETSLRFGRSALYGVRWKGIEFRDTVRHVPTGAKGLGELVRLPKLKQDFTSVKYAMRDAAIPYRTARLLYQLFRRFGERPRMTLPSTAYRVWQRAFFKRKVFSPVSEVRDAGKLAYYGGRTEAFAAGRVEDVRVVDAASMFPWAMTVGRFPVVWGTFERVRPGAGEIDPMGVYHVEVESDLEVPLLPYRTPMGTVFPNGRWRGWYMGVELAEFTRLGGRLRVLGGYRFHQTCRPFTGYVEKMFKLKQRSRGAMRALYKLLLCSLYGKFGQGGMRIRALPIAKFQTLPAGKAPLDFRVWCGLVIWNEEAQPPPWGNNVWSALVTARARLKLHREIMRVKRRGARPLYCDTDSIIYTGAPGRYLKHAKKPGDFELRGSYRSVVIVGKKEYMLEDRAGMWQPVAKGVPADQRERYLREGVARFSRPVKMREASRLGLKANVWREIEKHRHVSFKGRVQAPDGTLAPVTVDDRAGS